MDVTEVASATSNATGLTYLGVRAHWIIANTSSFPLSFHLLSSENFSLLLWDLEVIMFSSLLAVVLMGLESTLMVVSLGCANKILNNVLY